MIACNRAPACLLLVGAFALACAEDDRSLLLAPPSFSIQGDPAVSGAVLGPDGTSMCHFMQVGGLFRIRLINSPSGTVAAAQVVTCPAADAPASYSRSVSPGSYLVRFSFIDAPTLATLPLAEIDLDPVVLDGGDVVRDFHVVEGLPLLGKATFNGQPVAGVTMNFVQEAAPFILAGSAASGADGSWTDAVFGRSLMTLQGGITYDITSACVGLGTRALAAPPASFPFSAANQRVDCAIETAPAVAFSHTHTRLVVTPLPGDIGGQSVELADQYGIGWGVQFPVEPGQSPLHFPVSATHLFGGGLLIGIAPDRILSGISLEGQLQCGAACRDLGLDGMVGFTDETPAGKKVIWHYSDATSPEGVGLRVVQRSFDGQSPNDYVLFGFSIQNGGTSAVTFYAGVFMDWDVDEDATDDFGFTDLDGRLMGVTSAFESGVHVGSLLVGAPVAGNLFYNFNGDVPVPGSTDAQFQALSGGMRLTEIGPGDAHYIQGVGPVTLARGKKADIWLGIIAGDNRDQFLTNARAAAADIAMRQQGGGGGGGAADVLQSVSAGSRGVPMRPMSKSQKLQ